MNIKKLLPCLGEYKKYAILSPITIIIEVLLEITIPFMMAKIIDVGIANKDMDYILRVGGLMVLAAIVSLIFGTLCGKYAALAATGLAKGIRKRLFYKIQDFSFANVDHFSTASLVTRLTTDINFVQQAFMMIVRTLVRAPIMMISATIMAISIDAELAIIYLIAIPILGFIIIGLSMKAFPFFRKMFKKYDALNASVQENLIAIRVVKSFVRGEFEFTKFEDSATDVMNAQKKAEKIVIKNGPIMMLTINICIICIVWFGGLRVISGGMLTGELFSFVTYTTTILMQLNMITMVLVTIVISNESINRIVEVLEEKLDITDAYAVQELKVQDGSICFEDVSFSYTKSEDNLTLQNINLDIHSGETIGIIGGTGSSKTTLVQLIPRLYDVTAGKLLVGGHEVHKYELKTLRDAVSIVLQKNVLFSGTIKENLLWGNQDASDEEVEIAARAAQAYDFITSLPEGFETYLGQGGVNVSGGQKQRLCIARALLKRPKILILDDSTSAVDTATDHRIREAFKNYYADVTVLIIAQRIASVMDADRIIVMNEGQINGVGTHQELMENNEIYREVYLSQKEGAEL